MIGWRGSAPGGAHGDERGDERGSVAAEVAVALPAVVATLALCLGAIMVSQSAVQLTDAAADAARLAARGEPQRAISWVAEQAPGATAAISVEGDVHCVTATSQASVAGLTFDLHARSCALGEPG